MNSTFQNKIFVQTIRRQFYRYLSIQQNVNKTSSAHHRMINLHHKNENNSSCLHFSSLSRKILCHKQSLLYVNFHRNISNEAIVANDLSKSSTSDSPQVEEVTSIAESITTFVDNLSQSKLAKWGEEFLLEVHDSTGLPWWASIAVTAFLVRTTITLPFSIYQRFIVGKLEYISLKLEDVEKNVEKRIKQAHGHYGWPENIVKDKVKEEMEKDWSVMVGQEKCHPLAVWYLMIIQFTTWVAMTAATRNLCNTTLHPDVSIGGVGWITDLTAVDPYMILPISWVLLNLVIVQVHQSLRSNSEIVENWICHVFRGISLGLIPIAINMPAATSIYCLSSSLYGLLQAFILNSSPMLRLLGISTRIGNKPTLSRYSRMNIEKKRE